MPVKEDVHGRIVRAIAEIDRYLCSKQDLSQYDIDDIFERFKSQFPQIKCENCISHYNKDREPGKDFCILTDACLLNAEGFCSEFMQRPEREKDE